MPLVQIQLLTGRGPEEKKKLLAAVTRAIHDSIGAPLPSIRVWISELSPDSYMVAGELVSERDKPSS
jgi:4-oxalocrotonate tautomerase